MSATIRAALVTLIKSNRQKMGRAQRQRGVNPQRWLYPYATEARYAATIRAWLRPMKDYVHTYLKENQEAILRGDSTDFIADSISVSRLDAVPGHSFKTMINSLNGWLGQYVPDDDEGKSGSPLYMGLGNIADSVFDFNEGQFEKGAKTVLGVEFPVGEDWWPDAKGLWSGQNYDLIKSDMKKYIYEINALTEKAVTSGLTVKELSKQIRALDDKITKSRANFIARDQMGKLNGQITQRRMESVGLTMYVWETSGDERVRPSHEMMDEGLCRWDDSTVYSQDGGKTWINRPSGAVILHPGMDYQCRCTATAYWQELVGEADEQIDLLAESVNNIPNTGVEGLLVMKQPSAETKNETLKSQAEARERRRREENARKTDKAAKKIFPHEKWVGARPALFNAIATEGLDKNLEGIKLAGSKFPMGKNEETILLKELIQAVTLRDKGATVYLLPKLKDATGRNIPGPDAIVNGKIYEFKTITGGIGKVEKHFRDSRKQGENVYIRVADPKITSKDVIRKLSGVVNSSNYEGGFKGIVVFTVYEGKSERTYFIRIKDLKR